MNINAATDKFGRLLTLLFLSEGEEEDRLAIAIACFNRRKATLALAALSASR